MLLLKSLKTMIKSQQAFKASPKKFKNTDIRGINFSNLDLGGVDFSGSVSGQKLGGFLVSNLVLFLLFSFGLLIMSYGSGGIVAFLFSVKITAQETTNLDFISFIAGLLIIAFSFYYLKVVYRGGLLNNLFFFLILIFAVIALLALSVSSINFWIIVFILAPAWVVFTLSGTAIASLAISGYHFFYKKTHYLFLLCYGVLPIAYGYYKSVYDGINLIPPEDRIKALFVFSIISLSMLLVSIFISHKSFSSTGIFFQKNYKLSQAISSIGSTNFYGAKLTDCDFSNALIARSNFSNADLTRVNWSDTKELDSSRWELTQLDNPVIRKLVSTRKINTNNYKNMDLSNLNLDGIDFTGCDLSGADLSGSSLITANLEKTKLIKARFYDANLSKTYLTGAFIEDWAIATDTVFTEIDCGYIYMRLPTENNPDAWRKPDNRNEFFKEGDFSDFIAPIVRTLDLYKQPDLDMVKVANTFKTLDLYHHHGIDPSAALIALKQLASDHPGTEMEVVTLEGRGEEKVKLQILISDKADQSKLSQEYFDKYSEISSLPYADIQSLLASIAEKDNRIRSLEEMVTAAVKGNKVYIETQYNMSNEAEKPVKEHGQKKTILLLSANPKNTKRLRLDEEAREIQKSLDRAKHRDNFKIEQRWAVTTTDIRRSLLDVKPKIVHFSGHGEGRMNDGNFRSIVDIEERMEGLIFEDETGNYQLVPSNVLADLFSLFSDQIECIVLNSCYSETQATELIKFIPYVIGMKKEIGDTAAISFSVAFYDALLADNSIEFAFKVGCNGIQLAGIPEHLTPVLKVKNPQNKT